MNPQILQCITATSLAGYDMKLCELIQAVTGSEGIARAERDGTRAETRFRLSPKWTSPFKSVGASVQSTTGSRGVRISSSNGSNAGQTTFRGKVELYWLRAPFACFPFTSPPMRHRVPPGSERALDQTQPCPGSGGYEVGRYAKQGRAWLGRLGGRKVRLG